MHGVRAATSRAGHSAQVSSCLASRSLFMLQLVHCIYLWPKLERIFANTQRPVR
jgi:hypothetical protein